MKTTAPGNKSLLSQTQTQTQEGPIVKSVEPISVSVVHTKWFGLCSKCALLVTSLAVFGWGILTTGPTQGHQAGQPSMFQRLVHSTTINEQLEAERRIELQRSLRQQKDRVKDTP